MHLINKEIGRKIKTKRNEIGFKQEVLASELGISQSALSRMENGVEDISVIVLLKLSKILNTHISYFIAEIFTKNYNSIIIDHFNSNSNSNVGGVKMPFQMVRNRRTKKSNKRRKSIQNNKSIRK